MRIALFFNKNIFFSVSTALIFYLSLSIQLLGQSFLPLKNSVEEYRLNDNILEVYEDTLGFTSIQSLLGDTLSYKLFSPNKMGSVFFTRKPTASYWYRLSLKNCSYFKQHYLLESFNYRIDTLIVFNTKDRVLLETDSLGIAYPFAKRKLKHKNLVYSFWVNPGEESTIYIKIKNRYFTPVEFVLRKSDYFTSYAISEYFFLGLFYGSILIIVLINCMTAVYLKSKAHYFYSIYLFFVGVFFLAQDGIGFQYVWPTFQLLNDLGYMLSVYFVIVFLLLYTADFLNLKTYYPTILKLFYWFIGIRTILLIINLFLFPNIRHFLYIDVLPFLLAYYSAYLSYRSGFPLSKYFLVGFTVLIMGVLFNFMRFTGVIESNVYTFYFINICFLLEMIIFYFALVEKIRYYKQTSQMSEGLRRMVDDRENTIKQYTYKTSHDLSGPIKTILGLTNLALTNKEDNTISYMEMIHNTAVKMDEIIHIIAEINFIQAHEVERTPMEVSMLVEKVLSNAKIRQHQKSIQVRVRKEYNGEVSSDNYLIFSAVIHVLLFQLNSIRYTREKEITMTIVIEDKKCSIITTNNGEEIHDEYHEKLFDLFFRLSNDPTDIGTSMHVVKLCIDKLNGVIVLRNHNDSTEFEMKFPLN